MTNREEYLARLEVPSEEIIRQISSIQEEREQQIDKKYHAFPGSADGAREEEAAGAIQRTFRGYRQRKHLKERGLDPSTRWTEALKEARYRTLTTPHPRNNAVVTLSDASSEHQPRVSSEARQKWYRVHEITQRLRGDTESEYSESSINSSASSNSLTRASHHHLFHHNRQPPKTWTGKIMDLSYFLELVDLKHRYGANLRAYHKEWEKAPTTENFFYWLDFGEGKGLEIPDCPREKLEREQVRYLSKEERMKYLVEVNDKGLLVWAKDGTLVDTSEGWKNSEKGIVPKDDPAPALQVAHVDKPESKRSNNTAPSKPLPKPHSRKLNKLLKVKPSAIAEHLLRARITDNTWIFVFSTSHRLYISLKAEGTFQHSSFLHGSRISAAGLLTVSSGQLTSLSPLSGHYRPPSAAFRNFVQWLSEKGVNMKEVHLSKFLIVLEGLEGWESLKGGVKGVIRGVVHPRDEKKRRERLIDGERRHSSDREKRADVDAHDDAHVGNISGGLDMSTIGTAVDNVRKVSEIHAMTAEEGTDDTGGATGQLHETAQDVGPA